MKLFLVCTCLEFKNTDGSGLHSILNRMNTLSTTQLSLPLLDVEEVYEVAVRLQSYSICEVEKQVVRLLVNPDEIVDALKEDPMFKSIESLLS